MLEAVSADGIRQRVLYLADAESLDPQFFWFLSNEVPGAAGVLVIDECTAAQTAAQYRWVTDLAAGLPLEVAVVLVGPREYDAIGDYEIGELPVAELTKVVGDFAGVMPEPQREAIAARCGGSPKLVAYVSEEIGRRGGEVAWEDLERVQDVANFVNERLFPIGGSDAPSKVMRALCLFTRLGWRDEVEPEGRNATGFFGVDWTEAKLVANALVGRGVVSRRGRYLYPTPDILANSLTRNTVRSLGGRALSELFESMNGEAQRSMAENETYANNATGIWSRLFQVWLGGTAAPYYRRLTLLRETLRDPDPTIRKLGITALSSALQTRNMSRVGAPPEDTGRLPPDEWRPRDNTEWGEILMGCLEDLERALDDPDGSVRAEAISVIEDRGSDLIHSGLLDRWAPLARQLVGEPFEVRKRLLDVVEWQLRHGSPTDEERTTLGRLERELSGDSFSDRLRRVVGAWDYELEVAGLGDGQEAIRELVAYSLENIRELEAELPWLLGAQATSCGTVRRS